MRQKPDLRWLTPDTDPGSTHCRVLLIPDEVDWLAIVSGALLPLTKAENFEPYGTSSPDDTAARFSIMFDDFVFQQGTCRVIGEIVCYAGSSSPDTRWLSCDGSSLLRADYPDLFSVIGTTYGAADGTHFSLPDLQGRAVIGTGTGSGLSPRSLGDSLGEETHTLVTSEEAAHTHTDTGHTHVEGIAAPAIGAAIVGVPVPSAVPAIGATGAGFAALSSSGGDGAHNNIQPSIALNYYIVALP